MKASYWHQALLTLKVSTTIPARGGLKGSIDARPSGAVQVSTTIPARGGLKELISSQRLTKSVVFQRPSQLGVGRTVGDRVDGKEHSIRERSAL